MNLSTDKTVQYAGTITAGSANKTTMLRALMDALCITNCTAATRQVSSLVCQPWVHLEPDGVDLVYGSHFETGCHYAIVSILAVEKKMKACKPERPILLYPLNGGDWVGHYYHYLFGYLLPIALYPHRKTGQTCVLSVGHLDHITRDIFGDDVRVVSIQISVQSRIIGLRNRLSSTLRFVPFRRPVRKLLLRVFLSSLLKEHDLKAIKILDAYDNPLHHSADRLTRFRSVVLDRLASKLDQLSTLQYRQDVVVIERGEPGEQFVAIGQTAGKQRRSIPNINSLCQRLSKTCSVGKHCLEDMEFAAQITLFSGAKVVVAQHGAALSNIVWMRP
ncbi:MAG: glycosyltransferase family 61 protein, partial [Anderseniella sp.]